MSSMGAENVSCVWFDPSASITQICAVPVRLDVNAIRSRFGFARRPSAARDKGLDVTCVVYDRDATSRLSCCASTVRRCAARTAAPSFARAVLPVGVVELGDLPTNTAKTIIGIATAIDARFVCLLIPASPRFNSMTSMSFDERSMTRVDALRLPEG
jgi:hypothetical protein